MKKLLYIILVGACFIFQNAFCEAQWQDVASNNKDAQVFLDNSSIRTTENYVYYRARFNYSDKSTICWLKSDCTKNLTAVLSCKAYSKSNERNFFAYENSTKMKSFKSTSAVRSLHNNVCQINQEEEISQTAMMESAVRDSVVNSQDEVITNEAITEENAIVQGEDTINAAELKKAKNTKKQKTPKTGNIDKLSLINQAIDLLKTCPLALPYDIISGNNPYFRPVVVEFKKLTEVDKKYKNFDALGWLMDDTLHIYVDTKHINAPVEALAALIAGRSVHIDTEDSINEEIYAWATEGYVWKYLTKDVRRDPENSLVQRELVLNKIIEKSNDGQYLKKFITSDRSYKDFSQTSEGFEEDEFNTKFNELMNLYNDLKD